MKKQLHCLRVAYENWASKERFDALLNLLAEYDTGITQIALFSSAVHTPLTLAETRRRADIMQERLAILKQKGYTAGINILATIGHHQEDLDNTVGAPYRTMVGWDGDTTRGTFCMNDERFQQEYVAEIYRIFARTGAAFLWIDDDIRYCHMPIGNGCFCDGCIDLFNRKNGFRFTRKTLLEKLNEPGAAPDAVRLRQRWLDHNSDAICGIFRTIATAVRSVDETVTLGFMTGERFGEGFQFARYADVLSQGGKYEIMWRPGGGAYTDHSFDDLVEKSAQIGRQNAYLPPYVTVIVSEIENFPYNLLKKTPKSTAVEAAMTMTVGCNGAAFNILPSETGEPIETVRPHLQAIAGLKPFCEALQEHTAGLVPVGIGTGWRIDGDAVGGIKQGAGGFHAAFAGELFSLGLPQAFRKDCNSVTLLKGREAAVMSDTEIRKILSGGVYLCADAINYLTERGFGPQIGFAVGNCYPVDARECYTSDPLNKGLTGGLRNCRQAFNPGDSYGLLPLSDRVRTLARLTDYHGQTFADCSLGLYENEYGGRICAAGYYPFTWVSDYFKTLQLKRIFCWLSKNTLPSFVDSYLRIRNITLLGGGRTCVTLFNISNDLQTDVRVGIRTDADSVTAVTMYDGLRTLPLATGTAGYRFVTLDVLKPYEGLILSC